MLQISLLLMKRSIKPRLQFSICNVFFISKDNRLDFYFTSPICSQVPCGGGRPPYTITGQIIVLFPFRTIEDIEVSVKMEFRSYIR